jgi:hypothetical protein
MTRKQSTDILKYISVYQYTQNQKQQTGKVSGRPRSAARSQASLRPTQLPNKNSATTAHKNFTHLKPREAQAIVFYRVRMHLSISHIANIVERSTRTVAKLLGKNCFVHRLFDKRKNPNIMRVRGESWFRRSYGMLSWFYSVWVDCLVHDIRLLDGRTGRGEKPP